jgi:hypothetical protein
MNVMLNTSAIIHTYTTGTGGDMVQIFEIQDCKNHAPKASKVKLV